MWGAPYVSQKRELSNGTFTWNGAGVPNSQQIQRVGILRRLDVLTTGTVTQTLASAGSIARDVNGPWNAYSNIVVSPNQQAPVVRCSGIMAYARMLAHSKTEGPFTADTALVSETSADALSNVYNAPTTTGTLRFYHSIYIAQLIRSLGTEIGLWPLENPAVQMSIDLTPVGSTASSPYEIGSTTATQGVYLRDASSTCAYATPTVDIRRKLWEVPENPQDNPPYTFVYTAIEDTPQGSNPNSATFQEWKATPLSGVLCRLMVLIDDAGAGVAESKLTNSNSLSLLFGADTQKFSETGQAAHARQQNYYGFTLPQGMFIYDFLGPDLTLADTIDLYKTPEVRFDMNFSSALGSTNSFIRVLSEKLVPLEVTG